MILVDNASYSFLLQLNNGIPIIPFYRDPSDNELKKLQDFLMILKNCSDVRDNIGKHFCWKIFKKFSSDPNKIINHLLKEQIN